MIYSIQNAQLTLSVDTLGAQMMSILSADGCEYLWQGDAAYWQDRAPVLFPVIGRLYKEKHSVQGREYTMGIHGFAAQNEFVVAEHSNDRLLLRLSSSPTTLEHYPFPFSFEVLYELKNSTVQISFRVKNAGSSTMHFGVGGHPGFRVPLRPDEHFEDYRLEFSHSCQPERVLFSPQVLLNGQTAPYPLKDGRTIALTHELFDQDAIILQHTDRTVHLCRNDRNVLTVSFPDMPYIGFWHWPKTDAPYVCIEPWSSLPGRQDVIEDLSCRSDLIHLKADAVYTNSWSITVNRI